MLYTPITKRAQDICYEAHATQRDKAGRPYVFHPFHLAEQMTSEHEVCVALLHDVMEDTAWTAQELVDAGIPQAYVDTLVLLTHRPGVPYLDYVRALAADPVARAVKRADLLHNSDLSRLDHEPSEKDLARLERYRQALELLDAADRRAGTLRGPLGIIGAMQVEVELLLGRLEGERVVSFGDMAFYEGLLCGVPVVVVRCGVGKVAAASCAQALIDHFAPVSVINTGVAGALDAGLDIGDLVVSSDLVQYDVDVTGLGYAPGVVPELENGGLGRGRLAFAADERLADVFCRAAAEVAPKMACLRGRIASGDHFVSSREENDRIAACFGASCCEMEGAAIAQVCWRNDVPFVVVRAISDKADGTSTTEYRTNERTIALHCAGITSRAVELLG